MAIMRQSDVPERTGGFRDPAARPQVRPLDPLVAALDRALARQGVAETRMPGPGQQDSGLQDSGATGDRTDSGS
jgi:hypothetical protein